MKVALDTSYFLFGFQIFPTNIPQNCLDIIEDQPEIDELILSDMVIFEVNAKAGKLLLDCKIQDELTAKLRSDTHYTIILSSKLKIWNLSCFLRKFHNDFVDCIHLATAICYADLFLTEDRKIYQLTKNKKFLKEFSNNFAYNNPKVTNLKKFGKILDA